MSPTVVLAYSGGLDTSVSARTLGEERGLHVVAALVDVGQAFDPAEVAARAEAAGAELRVIDAREEFAESFCLPALHANALYEGKYPLVSALARPLIAAQTVRVAREAGARFVAHGCTGKGNDQVRFEAAFAALAPDLGVLAPVREAALSREEALALAERYGIPVSKESRTYSVDENLWGRTVECGPLEDPWTEPPDEAFGLTVDPRRAPDVPAEVTIEFASGRPVALDGEALALPELVARITAIGAAHGFGRVDMLENRLVGIKSRELYEVPGALALIQAHRDIEDLTLERELAHEKSGLERRWAELCYFGLWHGPLHRSLRAFMAETQANVTGQVRLRFFKGSCTVAGRRSDRALYDHALATYDRTSDRFDHRQAQGFVALWTLPTRVWAERQAAAETPHPEPPTAAPARADAPAPPAQEREVEPPAPRPLARAHGPVWAGRFEDGADPGAMAFTRSLDVDRRLVEQDLAATRAHVDTLAHAGLLDQAEREALVVEIDRLLDEARGGAFPFREDDEDVHSAVERVLTERLGSTGAKVHAGRSRNDLVVTDLRLWVEDAARGMADRTRGLAEALAYRAEEHAETLLPGYTHLQRAQPVTLGHHLLAHAFPLARDAERLDRAARSADLSGLGAGALAGSTLGLDAHRTAGALGFTTTFENSIDAVSDRDFALEFLAACAITAVHLSRLAEDLVLWSSQEFGFARPDDRFATGSSMMPHKRNPDVAELARGRAGRVLGDLVSLATTMKGLPLAYDRDLQEDKHAVFDAHDALAPALEAMAGMVRTLVVDPERMRAACGDGFPLATDLAERLVRLGVPFRDAHGRVAALVAALEAKGRTFADLTAEEWTELDPRLGPETLDQLTPEASVARRDGVGGPAPESVRRQLEALRDRLRAVRT